MTDIVNLNQFRKSRRRAEKERKAAENRVHFGRTRAQRALDQSEIAAAQRLLDGSRLEEAKDGEEESAKDDSDPGRK